MMDTVSKIFEILYFAFLFFFAYGAYGTVQSLIKKTRKSDDVSRNMSDSAPIQYRPVERSNKAAMR